MLELHGRIEPCVVELRVGPPDVFPRTFRLCRKRRLGHVIPAVEPFPPANPGRQLWMMSEMSLMGLIQKAGETLRLNGRLCSRSSAQKEQGEAPPRPTVHGAQGAPRISAS